MWLKIKRNIHVNCWPSAETGAGFPELLREMRADACENANGPAGRSCPSSSAATKVNTITHIRWRI